MSDEGQIGVTSSLPKRGGSSRRELTTLLCGPLHLPASVVNALKQRFQLLPWRRKGAKFTQREIQCFVIQFFDLSDLQTCNDGLRAGGFPFGK
jgi:hypothetical protein